jgi:hypothetical protein
VKACMADMPPLAASEWGEWRSVKVLRIAGEFIRPSLSCQYMGPHVA